MIHVKSVSKRFDRTEAVSNVSFTAVPGEILGLIGPNGAGKSTTIRMLMNILAPDSGEILFDGKKTTEQDKNRIGYLPEERGLYKKDKVGDVLLYFASLKDADMVKAGSNIDAWLTRFDLMAWKNEKVEKLSKGMSQKVQFIASVAHDPDIVFFDEPFSGLDPVSADLLKDGIAELGKAGKTVLFSTHIMEHAEKICSSIFLINKGAEVVYGRLSDIKNRYGSNTVAVEYDGDIDFVRSLPYVRNVLIFPRLAEIELTDKNKAGDLFRALASESEGEAEVSHRPSASSSKKPLSIRRFELIAPSLHNIFISLIKDSSHEKDSNHSEA